MGNTYTRIYLHIVFSMKNRDATLSDSWRSDLFAYIGGVIRSNGQTPMSVGGWRDHIHILVGANASVNIASLVREIKIASNKWIKQRIHGGFAWQDGYGCFSVSATHLDAVSDYIANQAAHHAKVDVADEFRQLLHKNQIEYEDRYLPVPDP